MADIVTSRIFADGEKNITAAKLNDIVGSSVIQPAFVSAKPSTSTVAPTDNLLILTAAGGTYAKAPFQTIIDSVNAGLNTDAEIWSVRQRSYNAISNSNFEIDQRNIGSVVTNVSNGALVPDRYQLSKTTATLVYSAQRITPAAPISVPGGSNFGITNGFLRLTLTTAQASLAAGDTWRVAQFVEGPMLRELINDVHSFSILVRSSVASLKFGIAITDTPGTKTLTKLCTCSATANTWQLIQLPNLPVFPAGNFSLVPGNTGYILYITLASGSTFMAPANDTWQNGDFRGAVGQANFAANAVNSTFDIALVQHEPGAVCSTPMDLSFSTNLDQAQRYFQKTYDYDVAVGTGGTVGHVGLQQFSTTQAFGSNRFLKPMAKVPALTAYNVTTGAVNSLRQQGGAVDYAVSGFNAIGKAGFAGLTFAATPALVIGSTVIFHYTADTVW